MSPYKLTASPRDTHTKTRRLLHEGFIPAVLYGRGIETKSLRVGAKEFLKVFGEAGTSQIIHLDIEGESSPVLVHDVQRDPFSLAMTHIDFYHTAKGQKVRTSIPLMFSGVSSGVKDKGGTLVTHVREIEVEALPEKLPPSFEVDVTNLREFGDEILVSDLSLPEGVALLTHADIAVVSLLAPKKEEEVKPVEEAKAEETPAGEDARQEERGKEE